MVSVTVEIRKSAPAPSAREPSAGSGSGKPASARPRSYPCNARRHSHTTHWHELAYYLMLQEGDTIYPKA